MNNIKSFNEFLNEYWDFGTPLGAAMSISNTNRNKKLKIMKEIFKYRHLNYPDKKAYQHYTSHWQMSMEKKSVEQLEELLKKEKAIYRKNKQV